MTVAMVALGIGTGITTGIATGIAMAPVGISKQGFYFNPVVMGGSSLWHNNALAHAGCGIATTLFFFLRLG